MLRGFDLGVDTIEDFISIDEFSALRCLPTFRYVLSTLVIPKSENLFTLFEEPEGLTNNFAGGVVAAGFHLALNELFEFWSEMDVIGFLEASSPREYHGRSNFGRR